MRAAVTLLVAVLAWAAAGLKLVAVVRQRGARAPRALFLTLLALAAGWTLLIAPVSEAVDGVTGVPLLGQLLADTLALCTGCGTQAMLVYLTHEEATARRLMRPRLAALAAAVAAEALVFVASSPLTPTRDFVGDYGPTRFYLAFSVPYLAYLAYVFTAITRLCWRYAQNNPATPHLKVGLRMIAAGGSVGLVYVVLRVSYLAAARFNGSRTLGHTYQGLSSAVIALVTVLVVVGATLPTWAPQLQAYRDVRQLYPLWRAMLRVFPRLRSHRLYPPWSTRCPAGA